MTEAQPTETNGTPAISIDAIVAQQAQMGLELARNQSALAHAEQQAAIARINIDQISAALLTLSEVIQKAQA